MSFHCSCGPCDDCPHPSGLAVCELHRDRIAVALRDGGKWCGDCAATFDSCPEHPEHPAGYDDAGLPFCQMCVDDGADRGAIEAMALAPGRAA